MNLLHRLVQDETTDEGQRFLMGAVDWRTYEKFLDAVGDRHIFLTYDGENLEFMSPSPEHEEVSTVLGNLVQLLAWQLNVRIKALGSTTFKRRDVKRGLEPDRCFYVRNVSRILGKKRLDLRRDPPPDLAIEGDVTHRSLDRMAIYAALRVPEIWRTEHGIVRVYRLSKTGRYALAKRSLAFPALPPERFAEFVQRHASLDDTELTGAFLQWVQDHILSRRQGRADEG
jgi:Uma2 family endonuclease